MYMRTRQYDFTDRRGRKQENCRLRGEGEGIEKC